MLGLILIVNAISIGHVATLSNLSSWQFKKLKFWTPTTQSNLGLSKKQLTSPLNHYLTSWRHGQTVRIIMDSHIFNNCLWLSYSYIYLIYICYKVWTILCVEPKLHVSYMMGLRHMWPNSPMVWSLRHRGNL